MLPHVEREDGLKASREGDPSSVVARKVCACEGDAVGVNPSVELSLS